MALTHHTLATVADIASICIENAPVSQRASAVMDRLNEEIPFEAASIASYDMGKQRHFTVAASDDPGEVSSYLNHGFTVDDPAFLAMRFRRSRPLRWCDIPNYADNFSAREVFQPSGFNEGVTTCLFTRDGRYTGSLHLSTTFPVPLSDAAVDCLLAVQPLIATLTDGLRANDGGSWELLVDGSEETAFLTDEGSVSDVRGTARGEHLHEDGALYQQMRIAVALGGPRSLYWVSPDGHTMRMSVTPVAAGSLVTLRREKAPRNLTARELEVLTYLARGLSNAEIGRELHASHRTVATHVERILDKLDCHSRVAAAGIATAEGIVLPLR